MARTVTKSSKAVKESAERSSPPKTTQTRVAAVIQKAIDKKINKPKKKKSSIPSYSHFIYKIMKQTHHDLEISSKAMSIMNSFVIDMIERLANEGSTLVKLRNSKTFQHQDIRSAVKLIIPGELEVCAVNEAEKAMVKYNSAHKSYRRNQNNLKQEPVAHNGVESESGSEDEE